MRASLRRRGQRIVCVVSVAVLGAATVSVTRHAAAAEAADLVTGINWKRFSTAQPAGAGQLRTVLLNANKYAMSTWWSGKGFPAQAGTTYFDFKGTGEPNIRPSASQALALAVSLRVGPGGSGVYDGDAVGLPKADAQKRNVKLIRSLAHRHRATTPSGGWGGGWQGALWATYAGLAGWLQWDQLTGADRVKVGDMVEYEANRLMNTPAAYYRDESGQVIAEDVGDSPGEQVSWDGSMLATAAAMMPEHPNRAQWLLRSSEYTIASFARPSDTTSGTVINGNPVRAWTRGSNVESDLFMVNHGRIHPDYAATISQNIANALTLSLAGQETPRAAFFNAKELYRSVVDKRFTPGPAPYPPGGTIAQPGGTVYVDGKPDIYFPQGNDWGTSRAMNYAFLDTLADAFELDTLASQKAAAWAGLHTGRVATMQARSDDRRTYTAPAEDTYAGREEWVAQLAARAYLARFVDATGTLRLTDRDLGRCCDPANASLTDNPAAAVTDP